MARTHLQNHGAKYKSGAITVAKILAAGYTIKKILQMRLNARQQARKAQLKGHLPVEPIDSKDKQESSHIVLNDTDEKFVARKPGPNYYRLYKSLS